ncbi:hypothetical protein, partial [Arthrobacter sp. PsM3]|uniref:hypothetical protein n=1 Tax=Arthrobacter sp. PsM3 TaxID=3030531 RepID=UPI00263C4B19|nr:hypothetical protein [Arthrobacter sp. PsM3]
MDPASVPLRARRQLRRVLLGGIAGIAWLTLSATVACADDTATPPPTTDGAVVQVAVPAPAPTALPTTVPAPAPTALPTTVPAPAPTALPTT